jgi:hypothetical protein
MSNFTFLTTYVLRTAALPVSVYTILLENYSTKELFKIVKHSFVKNAIRLASPEVLQENEKHIANPITYSPEKATDLEFSLSKYIARMCARATPLVCLLVAQQVLLQMKPSEATELKALFLE